jgi:hypothetical protein
MLVVDNFRSSVSALAWAGGSIAETIAASRTSTVVGEMAETASNRRMTAELPVVALS